MCLCVQVKDRQRHQVLHVFVGVCVHIPLCVHTCVERASSKTKSKSTVDFKQRLNKLGIYISTKP